MKVDYKVVIIGAGVIGLGVARALAENNITSVLIIEKEEGFGRGVSSRNSEVIHSGVYYPKESLKAMYCRMGREKIYPFCQKNDVWYNQCGKLIVAQEGQELALDELFQKAQINEVPHIRMLNQKELSSMVPEVSAHSALFLGCTGILSAHELMSAFLRISAEADHDLLIGATVVGGEQKGDLYQLSVSNRGEDIYTVVTTWVVNAAGLNSDIIAGLLWRKDKIEVPQLTYSKGSYFKLSSKWRNKFQHLIYPIPDKEHDSLGIHLSFDKGGDVKLGPSAEWLAGREEDYSVRVEDQELFYNDVKAYLPDLQYDDLSPDFSGIRPKLMMDNQEHSDFYIHHEEEKGFHGWINLIGIDSPGLTAAIAIGDDVARWIAEG